MQERNHAYLAFMLVLSLMALVALAVEALVPLSGDARAILRYADYVVCVLFFVDFLYLLLSAKSRGKYLLTYGWLDLASCVPILPYFRWGRAVRVVRIFRVLRGVRSARVLTRFILERRAQSALLAALLISIVLIAVSAVAVLQFEVPAHGNITKPEDAVWWAIFTTATLGFAEKFPVTFEGRFVAAILVIFGVGLFGTFSGFVASWFADSGKDRSETELDDVKRDLAEIKELLKHKTVRDSSEKPSMRT